MPDRLHCAQSARQPCQALHVRTSAVMASQSAILRVIRSSRGPLRASSSMRLATGTQRRLVSNCIGTRGLHVCTAAARGGATTVDAGVDTPPLLAGADVKVTPRAQNYSQWYHDVIAAAELVDHAPVRGCMVMRPNGYAVWDSIKTELDAMIKATGHVNAYFPLLIPQVKCLTVAWL